MLLSAAGSQNTLLSISPDRLPLLILCDRPRHIIHACAGYRVGSVDTALAFCQLETK